MQIMMRITIFNKYEYFSPYIVLPKELSENVKYLFAFLKPQIQSIL